MPEGTSGHVCDFCVVSKCTDDHMGSVTDCTGDLADLSNTVACRGKKMKDGAVVPHIVNRGLQVDPTDVRDEPIPS